MCLINIITKYPDGNVDERVCYAVMRDMDDGLLRSIFQNLNYRLGETAKCGLTMENTWRDPDTGSRDKYLAGFHRWADLDTALGDMQLGQVVIECKVKGLIAEGLDEAYIDGGPLVEHKPAIVARECTFVKVVGRRILGRVVIVGRHAGA